MLSEERIKKTALGFDYEGEIKELNELLNECEKILVAVGHIGVDFGYGKYELEKAYIEDSHTLFHKLQERKSERK